MPEERNSGLGQADVCQTLRPPSAQALSLAHRGGVFPGTAARAAPVAGLRSPA